MTALARSLLQSAAATALARSLLQSAAVTALARRLLQSAQATATLARSSAASNKPYITKNMDCLLGQSIFFGGNDYQLKPTTYVV